MEEINNFVEAIYIVYVTTSKTEKKSLKLAEIEHRDIAKGPTEILIYRF